MGEQPPAAPFPPPPPGPPAACSLELSGAELRRLAEAALDRIAPHVDSLPEQPAADTSGAAGLVRDLAEPLPEQPAAAEEVLDLLFRRVVPCSFNTAGPGYLAYIPGGGLPHAAVADLIAGTVNRYVGVSAAAPGLAKIESNVVAWLAAIAGYPPAARGILTSGGSLATFSALVTARRERLPEDFLRGSLYASDQVHHSVQKAALLAGFPPANVRPVATGHDYRLCLDDLAARIAADRAAGFLPFLVVGNAGSVNTGAVDPLPALADLCAREGLTFHIDGAYAALGMMSPAIAPRLAGIERADSIAFDFHKWAQVPYDAGFVLVRDGALHRETFATTAQYLRRASRGLAGGEFWPTDYGPDLSRGFRALKTWFTIKAHGRARLGEMIERSCELAKALEARILAEPRLELLSRTELNIVCFRYRASDEINAAIVGDLQESGIAAPSTTTIGGKLAIRAALVNHRTEMRDLEAMLKAVLDFGAKREQRLRAIP